MNNTSLILPGQSPNSSARKGMSGHHSARAITHTWLTPRWLLASLGEFDLDPCAAPNPRPWDTAKTHFTAPGQDGLSLAWDGRIWLNPPYGGQEGDWLSKLARHGAGTALIFARTETEAFHREVFAKADALLFLAGRLFFHFPDGRRADANAGAPSVLCAYGPDDAEILRHSGLKGQFVGLKMPILLHMVMQPDAQTVEGATWRDVVLDALRLVGGTAKLSELYAFLENHPKVKASTHWREKIRQTVGRLGVPKVGQGQYALAL
jgi:DNA N-6-adenine-methyltransferase (Dam)